jgi:FkbM family methyltransferase
MSDFQVDRYIDQNFGYYDLYGEEWVCPGMPSYLRGLKESGFEPKVIYDIGSCVGHWSRIATKIFPEAVIYCFEPNQDSKRLYINLGNEENPDYRFKDIPKSRIFPVPLSNEEKEVKFYYSKEHINGNSYYKENSDHFDNYTLMTTCTLDSFDIPPPDLVKIDTQGSEKDIIEGGLNKLSHAKHLVVEIQNTNYNEGAPQVEVTKPFIESLGFTFKDVIHRSPYDGDYTFEKEG